MNQGHHYYETFNVSDIFNLGLSVNNIPPFVKGGWGDFRRAAKANPPMSPFFKGGFNCRSLYNEKILIFAFGNSF
jgi:hypothetical protein